ncbi:MAG: M55 family metallopeptidase [Chloroflexota bacterium]
MKLFMLWDMEGVSGLFRRPQAWFWEPGATEEDHQSGRQLLMADINAAVAAALDAGADEVIVCDTHHGGGNIRIEELLADPRVTYLGKSTREENGRRIWMPGLNESVDGFMLLGHHAKGGTPGAFLPHAWSRTWADFRINGRSVGEIGIEACYAAHWGVPLILVQGDEAACREAEAQFPGVVTAAVKRAIDPDTCEGLDPEAAHRLTAAKVHEAIAQARKQAITPVRHRLPMEVSIRMSTMEAAGAAAQRPGVRRFDEFTVGATVEQHGDVVKWITGLGVS